jgi:hypothetical protein
MPSVNMSKVFTSEFENISIIRPDLYIPDHFSLRVMYYLNMQLDNPMG